MIAPIYFRRADDGQGISRGRAQAGPGIDEARAAKRRPEFCRRIMECGDTGVDPLVVSGVFHSAPMAMRPLPRGSR